MTLPDGPGATFSRRTTGKTLTRFGSTNGIARKRRLPGGRGRARLRSLSGLVRNDHPDLAPETGQGESAFAFRQLAIDDEISQRMATLEICNRRHNYHGPPALTTGNRQRPRLSHTSTTS